MSGLCECGCKQPTKLATKTDTSTNRVAGQPMRFVIGHNTKKGKDSLYWRGGRRIHNGYVLLLQSGHPRTDAGGYVREHILIVEKVLHRQTQKRIEIHHVDGDGTNNRHSNLVVCENHAYHHLLHVRGRALYGSGNPSWRKCSICHQYEKQENLYSNPANSSYQHPRCHNKQVQGLPIT